WVSRHGLNTPYQLGLFFTSACAAWRISTSMVFRPSARSSSRIRASASRSSRAGTTSSPAATAVFAPCSKSRFHLRTTEELTSNTRASPESVISPRRTRSICSFLKAVVNSRRPSAPLRNSPILLLLEEVQHNLSQVSTPIGGRRSHAERGGLTQRRGAMSSHGDAENAEFEPGRAPLVAEPSVPRPDPRSCCMWFLPVGSMLIPPRMLPGEAGSTPRTLPRPETDHPIKRSLSTPRSLRSARDPEPPPLRLRTSALSASPCEPDAPRLRVSGGRGLRGIPRREKQALPPTKEPALPRQPRGSSSGSFHVQFGTRPPPWRLTCS